MRPLPPRSSTSDEHAEAVSRRLATLSAELAAVRGDPPVVHRHTQIRNLYAEAPPGFGSEPTHVPGRPATNMAASGTAAPTITGPVVPMPGRHASRRLFSGLSARLPLTGAHVAVIAVVIALAVGVAAWVALRSDPEPVTDLVTVGEPLSTPSDLSTPSSPVSPVASGSSLTAGGDVTVDVAGRVRRPGIAVLAPGSRVVDALEAAGGARGGVDLASLNLARPLVDGEQILVGVTVPPGVIGTLGSTGDAATGESVPLVNLNAADLIELETLPGVGPVTAQAIDQWRTEHGGFTQVAELLEVDGIGDATLAQIAPHVTL